MCLTLPACSVEDACSNELVAAMERLQYQSLQCVDNQGQSGRPFIQRSKIRTGLGTLLKT